MLTLFRQVFNNNDVTQTSSAKQQF